MELKYVILDEIRPIIFSEANKHSDFTKLGKVTSAGFLSIKTVSYDSQKHSVKHSKKEYIEVETYGSSTSLNITPHIFDQHLLERLLNG
jgi:hypothetical protein